MSLTADDLLWNWARWTHSGERVGNMAIRPKEEEGSATPIIHSLAVQVELLFQGLPWHEQMIVIAEYPQKNVRFADLHARQRHEAARRWIGECTGVYLADIEYKLYLGFFKDKVDREVRR